MNTRDLSRMRLDHSNWWAIIGSVACRLGMERADLISVSRSASVVFARHVAMYLCRRDLHMSYPEIGYAFGKRDHTTVMHAVRKIGQALETGRLKLPEPVVAEEMAS